MHRYLPVAILVALGAFATIGLLTREHWLSLLAPQQASMTGEDSPGMSIPNEQVLLTPQARKNLKLTSVSLQPREYWRTIQIPALVVDRPGISDRGVVAPVTAVVTSIDHFAGETVTSGDRLFTLRLVGESFQASQTELFKTSKEHEIVQEELDRLSPLAETGSIPRRDMILLRNQQRRLDVSIQAHRQDLQIRGLSPQQIESIAGGTLVSDVIVHVPEGWRQEESNRSDLASVFEMQKVHVEIGQHVQAGERLATLSQHQSLFIEGSAFRQELPLLQRAAEEGWTIDIKLPENSEYEWSEPMSPVTIHHISNTLNDDNRTISVFLPLENQVRTYERDGHPLYLWRFRPGQRVQLEVRVEQLQNVFVVPAPAVVHEGPEAYVFRQNGDIFDRKPVHVLHETPNEVVIANDGSVPPGIYVAQSGAAQLNRVLKSQAGSAPSGVHVHADGSVHTNH